MNGPTPEGIVLKHRYPRGFITQSNGLYAPVRSYFAGRWDLVTATLNDVARFYGYKKRIDYLVDLHKRVGPLVNNIRRGVKTNNGNKSESDKQGWLL